MKFNIKFQFNKFIFFFKNNVNKIYQIIIVESIKAVANIYPG